MKRSDTCPTFRTERAALIVVGALAVVALLGSVNVTQGQTPGAVKADVNGDPLPPGAIARMGTLALGVTRTR